MRFLHCFLTLVLLLTTSLQSVAAVVMVEQPCPMQEQVLAHEQGDHQMPGTADCCAHDKSDAALNEMTCKTGAECHAGQLSLTINAVIPVLDAEPRSIPDLFVSVFPPPELASIWRPPARLPA